MNHENTFAVIRYKNRNGVTSWRVSGWLRGVRIRKNFKTREEAGADKAAMELGAEQAASGLRSISTYLTIEQVRESEAAFQRLGSRSRPLSFYLDYALTNYRDPVNDKPVVEAAREYLALRELDHDQGHLSHRQFTSFRCELRALEITFRGKLVSELTAAALVEFFKRGQVSRKSYNNRRGLIGAFLKYCLQVKDWIAVSRHALPCSEAGPGGAGVSRTGCVFVGAVGCDSRQAQSRAGRCFDGNGGHRRGAGCLNYRSNDAGDIGGVAGFVQDRLPSPRKTLRTIDDEEHGP